MDNHQRMQRRKAVVDAAIARADQARGVFLIHTGNGKGKSSAAFGVLARALGHGMKAVVVQFVKSRTDTGEEAFFRRQPGVQWHVMGEGFTWDTQDDAKDAAAARAAWDMARRALADPEADLVVLDEFTYALKHRWLDMAEVLAAIAARPAMQHLVVTGRAAPKELIEAADTVTDMVPVKHAFQAGVAAMPGIEW
ncbi:MAG: cob(I)yrinic acid a,c-diamide adenosyltransferase [Candidatus Nitricoxidivorans perseverans]|uniref:Corrinoid adenosyltransferase n=1 Tax=Candidatus Nitricoxidivorans perseverans TaxID=2975601 RepID=A0AA49FJM5_9PROT|nr:MAG: cob(I)yrinic acid a,c-diamide adenosyltransferase [Candidatus Nitricoxidivorans perseverans]